MRNSKFLFTALLLIFTLTTLAQETGEKRAKQTAAPVRKYPLVVIEGKEKPSKTLTDLVAPHAIESMFVLKGEEALKKYGEKGKNGVIEITLIKDRRKRRKLQKEWKKEIKKRENEPADTGQTIWIR